MQAYGAAREAAYPARVIIVAGEASADLYGSRLVRAVREMAPDVDFCGIGGRNMAEAGVRILFSSADMAVVGLSEVLSKAPTILKASKQIKTRLRSGGADLLVLIDYPGFNLHAAGHARRFGVPVLYYISPQVWAWRRGRVKKIARLVDRLAVILPFEKQFYASTDLAVDYVGHPLMDIPPAVRDRKAVASELGIDPGQTLVGLLPGSRAEEIRNLLPVMIRSAEMLKDAIPGLACVLPLADTIGREMVTPYIDNATVEVTMVPADTYRALSLCRAAMVTSGTATLETAIMGVPMVVLYRLSRLSYWVGKRVIKVPYISLVNLVAGKGVVRELIQDEANPDTLSREVLRLLKDGSGRREMLRDLESVRQDLGKGGAARRTARIALEMLGRDTASTG